MMARRDGLLQWAWAVLPDAFLTLFIPTHFTPPLILTKFHCCLPPSPAWANNPTKLFEPALQLGLTDKPSFLFLKSKPLIEDFGGK